jgi:leucine dehydrogenase
VTADIYAPCALGGTLNSGTIPELRCEIVAGAANNQLLEGADADRLEARGILYVPDFIANAGGVINGTRELLGWDRDRAWSRVEAIYDTTLEIFRLASALGLTTAAAAERVALQRLGTS